MGKKNLDSILIKKEKVLPENVKESSSQEGRKKASKASKERDSEVISFKITPHELATINAKAGELVSPAVFIRHYLRTKTDLFSESKVS